MGDNLNLFDFVAPVKTTFNNFDSSMITNSEKKKKLILIKLYLHRANIKICKKRSVSN